MAIIRHTIQGVMLIASAIFLGRILQSHGMDEGRARFWVSVFIVIAGASVVWVNRRFKPSA